MTTSKTFSVATVAVLIAAFGSLACNKKTKGPETDDVSMTVVTSVETRRLARQPSAVNALALAKAKRHLETLRSNRGFRFAGHVAPPAPQPAIQGDVTFTKSEIFDRLFLVGADLQYSSIGDTNMSLVVQAIAIGHVPARFSRVGDRLQLVADQTHLFQSDINHPGRLIHEWPIVREDATTVSVSIREASPTLVTILKDAKAPAARQTWVRSIEFVAQGNYLLLETSVEQADGTIAEFMESVFPRETLVPATAKALLADPAQEPLAKRYGFIGGDKLFLDLPKGRLQTMVASRFPVPAPGSFIEWYVTPNVPAIYLPVLKAGVEGWNRYSQKMWGRDFVRFGGVLPAAVKIGDPRYNVINWDSVPMAGAAYESQASDPLTGLQSHSLVYLPYAWVKIGEEYWKRGGISQADDAAAATAKIMKRGSHLGEKIRVSCMHDLDMVASLEARTSPEVFARELLKLVLFHEIGHAMGLAHNFKGSLAWKPDDPSTPVTTSVMDYNQYQLEGGLFTSETGSEGPLAEYDRQIISVLYNEGKDVSPTDTVLPACDDEVADDYDGGVDPLCLRYDASFDPTEQMIRTIALVKDPAAKLGKTRSLARAMEDLKTSLGDAATAVTEADVAAKITSLGKQKLGIVTHYYFSGAQSITYLTRSNTKMLYVLKDDVLPAPYDSKAMLTRTLDGIRSVLSTTSLEEPTEEAIADLRQELEAWVKATPWYSGLSTPDKDKTVEKKLAAFDLVDGIVEEVTLSSMRSTVMKSLVYRDSVPFVIATDLTPAVDVEKAMMDLLEEAVTTKMSNGELRPTGERIVAAGALRSFTPVPGSDVVFTRIAAVLGGEIAKIQDATERAELRALLRVVQTPPAVEKDDEEEEEE